MTLSTVRCRILGQAEIHTKGIRITPESDLQFGLALYFCTQAGRDISRDEMARLFWPTHTLEAGRHCLRQALYRLRVLGVAVRTNPRTIVLDAHFVDADFAQVTADGAPPAAFLRLTDVSVLPGYAPRFSRPFARWIEDFRVEVGSRIRRGLVRAISEMRARGRYADVERLCRFCLQLDPLNEEATLALAESDALAGGKAEAVGLIDRYKGEIGGYQPELRVPASLLRERISDRLIRRSQAAIELPMIGREQDVERILSAFQKLKGNRAMSYVVTGSAGVGKTRLAYECCRMAELQGARLLTIGTQPSSRTQALFAVSELVDGLLQMPGAIGGAPAALECLREMSSPLSVREPSLSLDTDGEARFAMVRWSILDVLDAVLSEGPLVIHVDDAHQLDAQSQAILQDALRTHAARPLLLLFTMRQPEPSDAERFGRLMSTSTVHDLLPLTDASCDLLVNRFCAANEDNVDESTRDRIIQLSGGNPFFLVELLRHRSDLLHDDLPITVQALLEDRLRRLSPIALTVLRAAAVLGLSSNVERVQRIVERKTSDVLGALTELHAAGMLSPTDTGTNCRHDSIREAVLERTPTAARVLLHRRAARALGREARREAGVGLLWECVHHWRSAGSVRIGIRMAIALARRLLAIGLVRDAATVLADVEANATDSNDVLQSLRGQAVAARMLRDWDQLHRVMDRWKRAHENIGQPAPRHSCIEFFSHEAHFSTAETFCSLPSGILECMRSPAATLGHRFAAAVLALIRAENDADEKEARDIYGAVANLKPKSIRQRIDSLTIEAVYHSTFGDAKRLPALLVDLVDVTRRVKHPVTRAVLLRRAAGGLVRFGPQQTAKEALREAQDIFRRLDLNLEYVYCVELLCDLGLYEAAYDDVTEHIESMKKINSIHSTFYSQAAEYSVRVRLAFEIASETPLANVTIPESVLAPFRQASRPRLNIEVLELARRLVSGELIDDQVSRVLAFQPISRNRCDLDFAFAVLADANIRQERRHEARSLLEEYLHNGRRERTPLLPSLTRVLVQLGIGEQFAHFNTTAS